MISKNITYGELFTAIEVAFNGDNEILKLYDPSVIVYDIYGVVCSIHEKIATHSRIIIKGVYEKEELIGYFVYNDEYLISFGLAVKFRARKFLRKFFNLIKNELGGKFVCFLFTRNQRAIRWLCKMGVVINYSDNNITQLQCH